MRHRVAGRKFGREADHRKAMLHNLAKSIIIHERVNTTIARAKEMRSLVERLITYGKKNSVHGRRMAFKVLQDRALVKKLFDEIAPRYTDRNGGYTRIYKNGTRKGDCALMGIIEFVEGEVASADVDTIKTEELTK
ncbi:MAG: 50S ribosomal protein L17 [Candidatus Zophobacter franzmannii]|nr:50S ribosomal protein L17 [Candidatus Zophobacter franzmannii]